MNFEFGGKIHKWIKPFMTGRTQTVTVRGASSHVADVVSGVPQGSVLGPILFIIYINDLPDHVSCNIQMFADDTKINNSISGEGDVENIQEDLENL